MRFQTASIRHGRFVGLLFFLQLLGGYARGAAITSAQSGNWSNTATWNTGTVPTPADTVTIAATHIVTVEITTAAAGATTINSGGTLQFSRVSPSSFTLVGGNLTINSGGTLDMGTAASPIPTGINAHLVLAQGTSAGQFGLIVNNGGIFTVRGSTKTPSSISLTSILGAGSTFTLADDPFAMGWSTGDVITVAPTDGNGPNSTVQKTIAAISGKTITVDTPFTTFHYASSTILVADLTRNVLVRSSGTAVSGAGGNSAYIRNLSQNAANFNLTYGEFAYLGANSSGKYGITFDGASVTGSISSGSVHHGFEGIRNDTGGAGAISYNLIYRNADYGLFLYGTSGNDIIGNHSYANGQYGFYFNTVSNARVTSNNFYSNNSDGANTLGSTNSLFQGNRFFCNAGLGINVDAAGGLIFLANDLYANGVSGLFAGSNASDNLFISNNSFRNQGAGWDTGNAQNNTLIGDYFFSNAGEGMFNNGETGTLCVECGIGISSSGAISSNGIELAGIAGVAYSLVLKRSRLGLGGIDTTGLNIAGNYILSYDQDYATGTIRLWGDYLLTASTITLDYGSQLYASTSTVPVLIRGSGHAASVISTNDSNAVSQLISIQRAGGIWQIVGSSSGFLGAFAGSIVNQPFPPGAAQFNLTLTQGGSPQDGDALGFALIAASGDQSVQKKMFFGPSAAGFNKGKSRLQAASSGGFVLKGISGIPAVMDLLPGGTYYTFIDSGVFTANFSSIANADSDGLQLSGSSGVFISNTAFDFMGIAAATNTYITARSLNSNAAMSNLTFNTSRSTASLHAYNIFVTGNDAGLAWTINAPALGPLWGQPFDFDPNSRITWGATNLPPSSPSIAQIYASSVTVNYGLVGGNAYMAEASTTSNFTGAIFRSSTTDVTVNSLTVFGLSQNTTYYLRAGALWGSATFYANTSPIFAVTLAASPDPLNFTNITISGFTLGWQANGNPPGTTYQASISTDIAFGILAGSVVTVSTSAVFSGLTINSTYYARVRAVNSAGTPSSYALGVVITSLGVITISANRIPNVWYNAPGTIFNAQGAVSYRYRLTANPADTASGSDPLFDGSALTLTVPEGIYYFHVAGFSAAGGGGAFMGNAHFGPVEIDITPPAVVSVSAQASATDATPIADGGTTLSATPRITWPVPASASPIVGYNVSVSTNAADAPAQSVLTTIAFRDLSLTSAALYYIKVLALDAAGNWGSGPAGMRFTFSTVPSASAFILKRNHFNPNRGECVGLDVQAAAPGRLRVELYTLLGERVSTWADQDIIAGIYSYQWCGKNDSGRTVATGAYLLHIEAPQQKKDFHVVATK